MQHQSSCTYSHRIVVRNLDVSLLADVLLRDSERPDDGAGVLDPGSIEQLARVGLEVRVLDDRQS